MGYYLFLVPLVVLLVGIIVTIDFFKKEKWVNSEGVESEGPVTAEHVPLLTTGSQLRPVSNNTSVVIFLLVGVNVLRNCNSAISGIDYSTPCSGKCDMSGKSMPDTWGLSRSAV